ncbi:MAG: hypothetical protein LAO21_03550 [Acidobacteriia bacterium]|nr:hypothetical protein [Terriglobia bacterium]
MKRLAALLFLLACLVNVGSAQTREQTTLQAASLDLATIKDAVAVSYLNFPWGEVTFSYIEHGTKGTYYGERTWPFAQLDTKIPLTFEGTKLNPGQFALVIIPGEDVKPMTLSVVQFDGPTFVKPGNIFSPAPKGNLVYKKDVSFSTVDTVFDHMKIELASTGQGFDLIVNYGNRRLTKSFITK